MPQHLLPENQVTVIGEWYTVTVRALENLWEGLLGFIPNLIGAIIVITVGWIISAAIGKLIAEVLRKVKFNQLFERAGWSDAMAKADLRVDAAEFIGAIFKWIMIIVFLMVASEILGFQQFTDFLNGVLAYLPNVVVAILMFVVAVVVADIAEKIVRAAVGGAKIGYAQLAGSVAKWAIWVFALLAIMRQLLIVPQLVDILFGAIVYGLVAFIALALGLSFGLGGRDVAAGVLQDLAKKLKRE